ncbi:MULTISPECIES: RDD family protein [Microbacterium]|uniref:RDD family protein n=1 Tax=Microbacterium TaxID=33882 RepID=UPI000D6502E1|nr:MULTISPECIES: RDD family protein [Microbacterium]
MTMSPPAAPAASIGRRAGAFAIDIAVVWVIGAVLIGIALGVVFAVVPAGNTDRLALTILPAYAGIGVLLFAWWLVYSAMQGGRGSIGQRLLGLRLRDGSSDAPIGFWRAVWRNAVFGLAGSVFIGYFTPLFDSSGRHQGWHDLAAKAVVVGVRKADAASRVAAPTAAIANPYLPPAAAAPTAPVAPAHRPAPVHSPGYAPTAAPAYAPTAAPGYAPAAASGYAATPAPGYAPTAAPGYAPAVASGYAPASVPGYAPAPAPGYPAAGAPGYAPASAPRDPVAAAHAPAAAPARSAPPVGTSPVAGAWITREPIASSLTRAAEPEVFPGVTMPFPAATTTEPLGGAFAPAASSAVAPVAAATATAVPAAALLPAQVEDDVDATRIVVPPPAQRAALYVEAPVIAVLTWDDGSRMAVYGRTLYGRNPASEAGAVAIPVRDETLSLSKTHFEIGGDAAGAWIVDRYSTNGTTLVRDGGRIPLVAGTRTHLRAGDTLEFGDRRAKVGSA